MTDDETKSGAAVSPAAGTGKRRYERPVLRHLGSVNRLTLSVSAVTRTDGTRHVKAG